MNHQVHFHYQLPLLFVLAGPLSSGTDDEVTPVVRILDRRRKSIELAVSDEMVIKFSYEEITLKIIANY